MSTHYTCDRCGNPMEGRGGMRLPRRWDEKPPKMPGLGDDGVERTVLVGDDGCRWYDLCSDCRTSLVDWVSLR